MTLLLLFENIDLITALSEKENCVDSQPLFSRKQEQRNQTTIESFNGVY